MKTGGEVGTLFSSHGDIAYSRATGEVLISHACACGECDDVSVIHVERVPARSRDITNADVWEIDMNTEEATRVPAVTAAERLAARRSAV